MSRLRSTLVTKLVLIAALVILGIAALISYSSIQRFFEAAHWVDLPGWLCSGWKS